MLCQKCKKHTATTQVKRTINGITEEFFLCRDCAAEIGFSGFINPFSSAGFFSSLFNEKMEEKSLSPVKRCPKCNSSLSDITSLGKVGCAECYSVFENSLSPLITKIHGTNHHCGKLSPNANSSADENGNNFKTVEEEIAELKEKLNEAVLAQEYEQAAVIRDKIKEMEEGK